MKQYEDTGEVVRSARKRDNHFSEENWSEAAIRYRGSIQNLLGDSWDLIIDGALKIARERKGVHAAPSSHSLNDMPETNDRGLLVEADEVVENDEIEWEECESCYCCS